MIENAIRPLHPSESVICLIWTPWDQLNVSRLSRSQVSMCYKGLPWNAVLEPICCLTPDTLVHKLLVPQ